LRRTDLAERRLLIAQEMLATAEHAAATYSEISNLVVKARIQLAQLWATLKDLKVPVQIREH